MFEELLAGGILLAALCVDSGEWDDDTGKRFQAEFNSALDEAKKTAEVEKHPEQNGRDIVMEINKLQKEAEERLSGIRNEAASIYSQLQSVGI